MEYDISNGNVLYNQSLPFKEPSTGVIYTYVLPNIVGDKLFIFGGDFRIFNIDETLVEVETSELYGRSFASADHLGGVHAIDFDGDTFLAYHKGEYQKINNKTWNQI